MIVTIYVLALSLPCLCQVRGHIGAGTGGMATGRIAEIHCGYGFSTTWSAESRVSFHIPQFNDRADDEWKAHSNEFGEEETETGEASYSEGTFCCGFRYWNRTAYEGNFIQIGLLQHMNGKTEIDIGAGCCLRIWKCLGVSITYSTGYGLGLTAELLF